MRPLTTAEVHSDVFTNQGDFDRMCMFNDLLSRQTGADSQATVSDIQNTISSIRNQAQQNQMFVNSTDPAAAALRSRMSDYFETVAPGLKAFGPLHQWSSTETKGRSNDPTNIEVIFTQKSPTGDDKKSLIARCGEETGLKHAEKFWQAGSTAATLINERLLAEWEGKDKTWTETLSSLASDYVLRPLSNAINLIQSAGVRWAPDIPLIWGDHEYNKGTFVGQIESLWSGDRPEEWPNTLTRSFVDLSTVNKLATRQESFQQETSVMDTMSDLNHQAAELASTEARLEATQSQQDAMSANLNEGFRHLDTERQRLWQWAQQMNAQPTQQPTQSSSYNPLSYFFPSPTAPQAPTHEQTQYTAYRPQS